MHESLELLALGEVISRKAHDSQLIGIRAALRGGAELGADRRRPWASPPAAGVGRRSHESIAAQLDDDAAAAARELAGSRPAR